MTLMGFKSIESIRPYYNIRESYFISPKEGYSNSSGRLVDALIKQLSNKKKYAIAKFVIREGSLVRFCAFMSQIERYNEEYFLTTGFNMIILPWADDLRANSDLLAKCKRTKPFISDKQSELNNKKNEYKFRLSYFQKLRFTKILCYIASFSSRRTKCGKSGRYYTTT